MFAGYGGASFALQKEGIEFECIGYSEIDKYAIQCFEQNHKGKNFGDCTKINPNDLEDFDLLTGGFPCQSFSIAGKGLGEQDTRGTLFHDIIRIAEVKQPKYMLLENVKGLTFKNHKATFDKILSELDRIGYKVYHKVLNSRKFGIPQNRERIFFVCFRKDIDKGFEFPQEQELTLFLKDILEDNVDDKYYLNATQIERLVKRERSYNERMCKGNFSPTLCSRDYKEPKVVKLINNKDTHIEKADGTSFTLTGNGRNCGSNQVVQINNPKHSNDRVYSEEGVSLALNTMQGGNRQPFISKNTMIRKLTPKECFRLMGFLNDEINLEGLSNTQRYKLAGNGWDINLVSKIFKKMKEE
jgi:DNA (cytosine-5)-methyltransferase 1